MRALDGLRELVGHGDVRGHQRAAVGWALDPEPAVEDVKPVRQPDETAAVVPRASHAVVAHPDAKHAVLDSRQHRGTVGTCVLATLVSASATTKYAVASTPAGSRPTDTLLSTGTGIRPPAR
jgi:hypothetical protein